ncbi:inorganic polyphosphate/ATP-NAD kinase [Mycobacterium xenopi 4042]|uniref:Inorganic polyphosphate/ATP-NAD kinase n=1 Tax=Mycobacterium xenopi 4042 TaxID=1299334 RepID=X8BG22_MYCXE|nr:inorganic polyphosphate/ATP-NAD kinase [Mycobacterium xenopi 4042]
MVARNYRIEDRLTLDIVVRAKGQIVDRGWAMNEASLEKGPGWVCSGCSGGRRSTGVDVRLRRGVGGNPDGVDRVRVLGGGPVLWPDLEAILVVPNNAHALFARPMVTSPDATIAIEVESSGHNALVFCDGRREMQVPAGGRLEVTRCDTPVKWARLDSAPFTDRLVRKFRLPVSGWRGQ